jgi:hypothetical protein
MRYEASEWEPGDLALVLGETDDNGPKVRMLVVTVIGHLAGRRLWWGATEGRSNYFREDSIRDIERVTVLTEEQLNRRVEVNP